MKIYKQKTFRTKDLNKLEVIHYNNQELVKQCIKECEGKHIQQVVYSTYHDAFTQICFGCKKIRTSLKKEELTK